MKDRLRDREACFAAFMEHLPGLATMRNVERRYLLANLAWEEMRGIKQGTWQGKTLAELWPPEQGADLQRMYFQIIATGKPLERVEMQELVDGLHHFLARHFPILDKNGPPNMVGNIANDVTAEQRAAGIGRLYRVLSQVNEAILQGQDPESLFLQICRIAVEEGLFRMDSSSL